MNKRIILGAVLRLFLAALIVMPFQGWLGRDTASAIGAWIFIALLVIWPFQKRILGQARNFPDRLLQEFAISWEALWRRKPAAPVNPPYNPTTYPPNYNVPPSAGYTYGPPPGAGNYYNYPPAPGPAPYS